MKHNENTPEPVPQVPFRLDDFSPNTHMILGALLSGGDPLKLAQMLVDSQKKNDEKRDGPCSD